MGDNYLESIEKQFRFYKHLAEKTIEQLTDEQLHHELAQHSNSVAIIIRHICGNIKSRFTNFLTEDGEKHWREREKEFTDANKNREQMIEEWEHAWECLFDAIQPLKAKDLLSIIYIRNEGHTVIEALNRQLTHYAYHVGQIVYLGKLIKGEEWKSLSIPRGKTEEYNRAKFEIPKGKRHFSDGML